PDLRPEHFMQQYTGLLGVVVLLAIAVALSTNRRAINWRIVAAGTGLQLFIAVLLHKVPGVMSAFDLLARAVTRVISFAGEGVRFLFGNLADTSADKPWGFVFAIHVLPIIIFFSAFMAVLYHLGVMQRLVAAVAWGLRATLGITGVEALSGAANIFVGQTEAPLTVKPYIAGMTRSQLMAVMVGGFATIAGSVMAAYISMLGGNNTEAQVIFAKHIMTASLMSAPAAIVMAKIMLPETESPRDESLSSLSQATPPTTNVLDAAASGATDGLRLAANVAAMLVAFVALLAMVNWPLAAICEIDAVAAWREARGIPVLSLQNILGFVLTPVGWLVGAGTQDAGKVGALLGTSVIATEFIGYQNLSAMIAQAKADPATGISPRAAAIATYCLCGFANIPSIAIQIGGLSAMAPTRRSDLASLAPRAMVAGALACWMTGALASLFIPL
ncbi:MAG: nucleoside transporter C-terminal domain-containing protein, partial [Phycisphaerales bacterium]|nr:nucleoside transporter C-terminal domain-containing protein [Phycisphaerales bacterium]